MREHQGFYFQSTVWITNSDSASDMGALLSI